MLRPAPVSAFFFFNDPAPTEIYPLSLHDALPILGCAPLPARPRRGLRLPSLGRTTRPADPRGVVLEGGGRGPIILAGDYGRVGEEDGACATKTVSGSRRRPSTLVALHTMRTGTSGATGSHMSFRVSRNVGRNVRAVLTSRRSTFERTVDSTKSAALPRSSPRGPIACVPPWNTMFSSVPTRFA